MLHSMDSICNNMPNDTIVIWISYVLLHLNHTTCCFSRWPSMHIDAVGQGLRVFYCQMHWAGDNETHTYS